ncbi:uncharacterized protein LOC132061912 [Lycium ferocissimum]|uniref:uncharacterized protein LOC132061912 n=1 Tax=Lycium ferocissimum TaxID=112874 RepID=UPI00281554B6|nr:uncharacterized protein LOC132061912 [Lycium ferocissimum]
MARSGVPGQVAYELELPPGLEAVHQITENLSYEEESVAILDRQVRRLRTKNVVSVKVLWRRRDKEEMTWEAEEEIKSKYHYLFLAVDVQGETLQNLTQPGNNLQG